MHIFFAADHAGYLLKNDLQEWAKAQGYDITDLGTHTPESTDYPDYGAKMAHALKTTNTLGVGVIICGSGVGISIAANRFPHIRAAVAQDPGGVALARCHNDINVLALGARLLDVPQAIECLEAFLKTPFEGGRHQRRVEKLMKLPNSPKDK